MVPPGGLKESCTPEVSMRENGLKTRTYADVAKLKPVRKGDRIWLELEEREMQGRNSWTIVWWVGGVIFRFLFLSWIFLGGGCITIGS